MRKWECGMRNELKGREGQMANIYRELPDGIQTLWSIIQHLKSNFLIPTPSSPMPSIMRRSY